MAMDWNDPNEIEKRRVAAIQAGFSPKVIDQFINEQRTQSATMGLLQSGVLDINKIAESDPLLAQKAISAGVKAEPKLTADDVKKQKFKEQAARIVTNLEDMYFGAKQGEQPLYSSNIAPLARTIGFLRGKSAEYLGTDPALRTYVNTLDTVKPFLAKAAGQTGQLTEKEQERSVKQLPSATSTPDEAKRGFNAFRLIMGLPMREETQVTGGLDEIDQQLINKYKKVK